MDILKIQYDLQKKYLANAQKITPDEQEQIRLVVQQLNAFADGRDLTTKLYDGGLNG